jgi:hypothetical protein
VKHYLFPNVTINAEGAAQPRSGTQGALNMKRRKSMSRKSDNQPDQNPPNVAGGLGRDIQTQIGDQLRALHDDIVKQGVPDRFVDLLARLDKAKDENGE